MWFDQHLRYESDDDAAAALYDLFATGSPNHHPFDAHPNHLVCLEMAPQLDTSSGWWTGGGSDLFPKFLNMPDCNDNPGISWEDYIGDSQNGWRVGQSFGADFDLETVLVALFDHNVEGVYPTVACYGSTLQLPLKDPPYDLAALRAQNVCDDFIEDPDHTKGYLITPVHLTMELSDAVPGVAGQDNTLTITGATPGSQVRFVYSRHGGGTAIPGCRLQQNCLQLDQPHLIGTVVADGDGNGSITAHVPISARGQTVLLQAFVEDGCAVRQLVVQRFE